MCVLRHGRLAGGPTRATAKPPRPAPPLPPPLLPAAGPAAGQCPAAAAWRQHRHRMAGRAGRTPSGGTNPAGAGHPGWGFSFPASPPPPAAAAVRRHPTLHTAAVRPGGRHAPCTPRPCPSYRSPAPSSSTPPGGAGRGGRGRGEGRVVQTAGGDQGYAGFSLAGGQEFFPKPNCVSSARGGWGGWRGGLPGAPTLGGPPHPAPLCILGPGGPGAP